MDTKQASGPQNKMPAKRSVAYFDTKGLAAPEEIISSFQSQKYYFNKKHEIDEA